MKIKLDDYIKIFKCLDKLNIFYDFTTLSIKKIEKTSVNTYQVICAEINGFDSYSFYLNMGITTKIIVNYPLRSKHDTFIIEENCYINDKESVTKIIKNNQETTYLDKDNNPVNLVIKKRCLKGSLRQWKLEVN